MPRWPKGYKKKHPERDYNKETQYENRPDQVNRREDRNTARDAAEKAGKVHKGDGKEVDHLGHHRKGRLKNVPTKVVSQHANRIRQPKRSK